MTLKLIKNITEQKSSFDELERKLLDENMSFELANLYRSQGEYQGAVCEVKKLLTNDKSIGYKITLSDIYIENSCHEMALIHIDEILNENIKNKSLIYITELLKIECLVNLSRPQEALKLIEKIEVDYLEEELLVWKALSYLKLNNLDLALDCYEKSILLNSNNEKTWVGIGSIHCIKADYDLGNACFLRALDINDESIAAINLIQKFKHLGIK